MTLPIAMEPNARIFVAGHRGMVGSAIVRRLQRDGYTSLLLQTHAELDLTRQDAVERFFAAEKPEYVFDAAARVGGILANSSYAAEFIGTNLAIQNNLIHTSWKSGVKKFLFLGSSCIYPKFAPQPMNEDALLTGELEPTNQWYAIAKIAGIKMVEAYRAQYGFRGISLMPTNLYGPGDNFHPQNSHVVPALIRRFHEARVAGVPEVVLWGSGQPRREFLHVDDLAEAAVHAMRHYDDQRFLNVGTGEDVTIADLAEMLRDISGYSGRLTYDATKPDGTPRKLLDVSRIHGLGWRHKIGLREGLESAYKWYLTHAGEAR